MSKNNLIPYFIEFRRRLLHCLLVFSLIFSGLLFFANDLYTLLALPLLKHLPNHQELISINIVAPFFVPFELALFVALFFSVPFFLYQIWMFVAPALYQRERKFIWPLLFMTTILFYCGIAFAYFIVFPLLFNFFVHSVPHGVSLNPDISQYLDFTLKLFFVFGVIFEVPVITVLLIKSRIVSREKLLRFRPYAIVSAFVIGMLFAPPDVISQTLLAIPLWLLFELGIILSQWIEPKESHDNQRN